MHRGTLPAWILLLTIISGCSGMNTLRLVHDKPEDLEQLLEQHEFVRVRQLTGEHPSLDTLQLQTRITRLEAAYEAQAHADAHALQSGNNLIAAVQLLSDTLQKVPHSSSLRELRTRLEQERIELLAINEREHVIARAQYIIDQQKLYDQQTNLELPDFVRRQQHKRNRKEAESLSLTLINHGQSAMQQDKLDAAETWLHLSLSLNESPDAKALLAEISNINSSRKTVALKKATRKRAKKRKDKKQDQKNKTRLLVKEARQALAENDLQLARAALVKIPPSTNSSEVAAVQGNLQKAVTMEIDKLITSGDALYRSDNVVAALGTWAKALALAPENHEIRGRIERANKVLVRLQELKRQQAQ